MNKVLKILSIIVAIGLYIAAMLELYLAVSIFKTLFTVFTIKNLILMIVFLLSTGCLLVFAAHMFSKSEEDNNENH